MLSSKLDIALVCNLSGKASVAVGTGVTDDVRLDDIGVMPSVTETAQSPDPSPLPCPAKPGSTADAGGLQLWDALG